MEKDDDQEALVPLRRKLRRVMEAAMLGGVCAGCALHSVMDFYAGVGAHAL